MQDEKVVLSAEDLLEQVRDEHADPFTNTVLVTISRFGESSGILRSSKPFPASDTASQGRRRTTWS